MSKFVDLRSKIEHMGVAVSSEVPLAAYSTFRIGGPARLLAEPGDTAQLVNTLRAVHSSGIRYTVIGNGSNILFDDGGYDGVIISTLGVREALFGEDGVLKVQCGAPCTATAYAAALGGWSGLEFAYGIPGSFGGAVYMNAGAYGSEISNVILSAECYDTAEDRIVTLDKERLDMSYRHSALMSRAELIVVSASLKLTRGDSREILALSKGNMALRREKQPRGYSAGSVFKRHEKYFLGKVIEDCGLKGYAVGGAQVSVKHAGFIMNQGGATSDDVLKLISHIKNVVMDKYGFEPECEIRYIH